MKQRTVPSKVSMRVAVSNLSLLGKRPASETIRAIKHDAERALAEKLIEENFIELSGEPRGDEMVYYLEVWIGNRKQFEEAVRMMASDYLNYGAIIMPGEGFNVSG